MKIIAHRGWSAGEGENTITAIEKAIANSGVNGIEVDVHHHKERLVVTHDLPSHKDCLTLEEVLSHTQSNNIDLFLEMKEFKNETMPALEKLLGEYDQKENTLIFGFRKVAEKFPWKNRNGIKLGIISEHPWEIKKDIKNFNPDFVLIGWDNDRSWTKKVFKFFWSCFSLQNIIAKHEDVNFIIGVANSQDDLDWLRKIEGLHGITADKPFMWK